MSTQLQVAELLSSLAHKGQTDKTGTDYYQGHIVSVVQTVRPATLRNLTVAYLHDILEDTAVLAEDLYCFGFDESIVRSVSLLTRPSDITYLEYVNRIARSLDRAAIAVKIADLRHHLVDQRPLTISAVDRYKRALDILNYKY